ncbi:MAG: hypothetical protein ABI556_01260 [Gemmatimonadales bacterium]
MQSRLAMYSRFITGMPAFLRQRITPDTARDVVAARMLAREQNFIDILERAVFARPESPYTFLFKQAGCEPGDIRRLVSENGVDAALAELYDAGVKVSFDEVKGRAPLTRGGKTFDGGADAFDNPLVNVAYEGQSSGSTGRATNVKANLSHVSVQTAMMLLGQEANGTMGAPVIVYRPGMPCNTATSSILRHITIGNPVRRWFSPVAIDDTRPPLRFRVAGAITPKLVRLCGFPFPEIEVVPFTNAIVVARAAAAFVRDEGRCLVRCPVSAALTVSIAAVENGVDLSGVSFCGGGEPPSPGKIRGINASGARYVTSYAMTEAGSLGIACPKGLDSTDLHLMRDRAAMLQRMVTPASSSEPVGMFFLTTLLPAGPKILINVATDDFGILEERECGCPIGALGMHQHLRRIRSVGKLTGRGITLVASDITHIIEDILPGEFGGTAQDYQLVEEEDNQTGATHLHLLVSPSVQLSDESAPARALLEALTRGTPGASLQSAMLRSAEAVRVRRQQPRANARGKLPAFRTVASR